MAEFSPTSLITAGLLLILGCAAPSLADGPCAPNSPDRPTDPEEFALTCVAPRVLLSCHELCKERGGVWQILIERPDPIGAPATWSASPCRCADQFTKSTAQLPDNPSIGGIHTSAVGWRSLEDAKTIALSKKVPVLLVFAATGCPDSYALFRDFLSDPSVVSFIRSSFVPVLVLDRGSMDEQSSVNAIKHTYRIEGSPTLVVLDPAQGEVARQLGWSDAKQTMAFLSAHAR